MDAREAGFANRFAVYTRVSTAGQADNTSPEAQYEACKAYGLSQGWELLEGHWFHETVSGTKKGADRDILSSLMDLVESKTIKHVVIRKVDRIAREQAVLKEIIMAVYAAGGKVSIADKGMTYQTYRQCAKDVKFESFFAEMEREGIVEKNWEGRINQFKKGSSVMKLPYGYISKQDESRKDKFKLVVINPSEADALVDFLTVFADCRSIKKAIDHASARGYRTRSGKPYTHHFFRDTLKLLDQYNGQHFQQTYSFFDEVETRTFHYPKVVSDDLYHRVKEAQTLKTKADNDHYNGTRPYQGLVFCSHCGEKAGVRFKTKKTLKRNGEQYKTFIVVCTGHRKVIQASYRNTGKHGSAECGKSFRYTELTKKLLEFVDEASTLGTTENYAKELTKVVAKVVNFHAGIKSAISIRNSAAKKKDELVNTVNKLALMEGVDVAAFIAANAEKLAELDKEIALSNRIIAEHKQKAEKLEAMLKASGLEVTEELIESLNLVFKRVLRQHTSLSKGREGTFSGVRVSSPRRAAASPLEGKPEDLLTAYLPETVTRLAGELAEGLAKLRGLVEAGDWDGVNTVLFRLGIRFYADFNAPLGKGNTADIKLVVNLAESDLQRVIPENTTRGHALKNIPMLREALNARGVPVRAPDPPETDPADSGRLL
ncbi:Putative serine recombinase family, catalytic domain (Putative resolvase, integrase) [Deinococcus deserti]|uniref:Putative serine recombinase family, catalytic domain (Putative resolvase, integrase) n=1 Tax=Deinococcus deserti (strain DSM 17065 / CIP 109153 / LMG 22923 / VCD115) TaxID=546414 RepID=C1CX42_DEIDV|nr:putative serine recombinase family, catalytic domain (putative resolvase, integrase) [Deinococcus deserti VCD115]